MMFRVCQCSGGTVVSVYWAGNSSAMRGRMRLKLFVEVVGYATVQATQKSMPVTCGIRARIIPGSL
ncbi:UNVERIFIED_CONTAM: hypothetical protein Sradi_2297200 [Sesamum radiatum]|uniref:Uncharacterized protein n=1 Tax=Sesamum radiatum TaxID=300843 RepID=A0AAW2T483_SESRA